MRKIEPGEIYLIDASRNNRGGPHPELMITMRRAIFFDDFWVFVDLRYDDERWEMDKMRKGLVYFGPTGRYWFDESPLQLGFSEVSPQLKSWFRTDLILRISRIRDIGWNDPVFQQRDKLNYYLNLTQSPKWLSQTIDAEQIYLVAHGRGDGTRPPVLITAENRKFFTAIEVLWNAAQIQLKVYSYPSKGVGVFRSGSKGGIAVYYIGQYLDRAGILEYYESQGIDTNV
jgi:hypothetical protein